jgi:polysaccharide biosynthesis/export protein
MRSSNGSLSYVSGVKTAFRTAVLLKLVAATALGAPAQQAKPTQAPITRPAVATSSPPTDTTSDLGKVDDRYRIGPGDLLDIRVLNRPMLSREVRVGQDGMIRMPFIDGEIQAACRTEGELSTEIATRLLKYQRNPQVDVFVKDYQSQPVAFIGSVRLPGRFQLQRRVRLLELMTYVGGPSDNAGRMVQIVHTMTSRSICDEAAPDPDGVMNGIAMYRLVDLMHGDDKANPYVRPGDIITLPEAEQAYVIGSVMRPGPILLKEPTTLSKAVVMSGGAQPQASTGRVRIIRQGPETNAKIQILADLKAINKGQAEDIMLQAGDVVDVPGPGGFTKVLNSITQGLIPSMTNLPLRVIP